MKKIACITAMLLIVSLVKANDSIPPKHIIFKTQVYTTDGKVSKGYLTQVNDSMVTLAPVALPYGTTLNQNAVTIRAYPDLSYVHMHRKGNIGRGALYGALAGLTAGVLIALIEGSDPYIPPEEDFWGLGNMFRMTTGEKMMGYGTLLAAGGSVAGMITAALMKKKFIINGNKEKFSEMKTSVLDKVYGN